MKLRFQCALQPICMGRSGCFKPYVCFGYFWIENETVLRMKPKSEPMLSIFPFQVEFKDAFFELNAEWLEAYFLIEPYDLKVLSNPQEMVLDRGGEIYFGAIEGEVVATFALTPTAGDSIELNKMAVRKDQRGSGIGNQLMDYILRRCKARGVGTLELYSNTRLQSALHLYRKYGFVEIPLPDDCVYDRANIRMELSLSDALGNGR